MFVESTGNGLDVVVKIEPGKEGRVEPRHGMATLGVTAKQAT